jgi:hypothetical protein
MAWERRARGSLYYTRSKKVGGRVVRKYVGGGRIGSMAAALDAKKREAALENIRACQQRRARLEMADAVTKQFARTTEIVTRAILALSGFHQHHRGEWRRTRGKGSDKTR